MGKNIEKLAEYGEFVLEQSLVSSLKKIQLNLRDLSEVKEDINLKEAYTKNLKLNVTEHQNNVEYFKKEYGLNFPELNEKYKKLLPEIIKYSESKIGKENLGKILKEGFKIISEDKKLVEELRKWKNNQKVIMKRW